MISKVVSIIAVLSCASAQHHGASSYSSSSFHGADNHHNYHQGPVLVKSAHIAPVAAYHHTPTIVKAAHIAPIAHHAAPVAYHSAPVYKAVHHEEYPDVHPQYAFQYGVKDAHTGDIHNQQEERDGDVVKGAYSLVQPDGITRVVHYTADKNGFNAHVEYSGHADHPQQVHKAVVAAPAYYKAAPVQHAYHH